MGTELKKLRSVIQQMKAKAVGLGKLTRLDVPRKIAVALRRELKLVPDADIVVDGVPIFELSDREEMIHRAVAYANVRWAVVMTNEDAENLLKAVPTEELRDLIPLVMNQHLDDKGFADPLDEMDASDVKDLQEKVKELGFVDSTL